MLTKRKRYTRLASGILVPRQLYGRSGAPSTKRDDAEFEPSTPIAAKVFNALSLLIQLATVFLLWLTFRSTVIPIHQKELLAEQVASLERERQKTVEEIESGQDRVAALGEKLVAQEKELARLTAERVALESDAKMASEEASAARESEQMAREDERLAKVLAESASESLESASWRILLEEAQWKILRASASFSLDRQILQNAVDVANQSGTETQLSPAEQIERDIASAEVSWPDSDAIIGQTASLIRDLRSPHYRAEMTEEFASQFELDASEFRCPKPDFAAIKSRYLASLDQAAQAKPSHRDIGAQYRILSDLSRELIHLPRQCGDRFAKISQEFIDEKLEAAK